MIDYEKPLLTLEKHNDKELFEKLSIILDEGKVIVLYNVTMEFGSCSLGFRAIFGHSRNEEKNGEHYESEKITEKVVDF